MGAFGDAFSIVYGHIFNKTPPWAVLRVFIFQSLSVTRV